MSTNPTTSRFTLRSTEPGRYTLTLNGQEVADCTAVSVVVDAGRLNDDGTPIRWEQIGRLDQHAYRELVLPIVHAAAPHIAEQVRQ